MNNINKSYPCFFIFLLCSCISNKNLMPIDRTPITSKLRMDLQVNKTDITGERKHCLFFTFYNDFMNSDSTLYFSVPCFLENVNIRLYEGNVEKKNNLFVKVAGECGKSTIEVKSRSKVSVKLDFDLDDMFIIDEGKRYFLKCTYSGIVFLNNGIIFQDNRSEITKNVEF